MDKVSDTPRTDASYVCHYGDGLGQWVPREFACELERELAAQKEQFRVLQDEMLVMMDERNAAVAALHVNAGAPGLSCSFCNGILCP